MNVELIASIFVLLVAIKKKSLRLSIVVGLVTITFSNDNGIKCETFNIAC